MLGPICKQLASKKVILASGSPRRRQILENIGLAIEVVPSEFEENLEKTSFKEAWQYAVETARMKAIEVAQRLKERTDWKVVLGADTVVVFNDTILEKPITADRSREMLKTLSGHTHLVYTGVALVWRGQEVGGALSEHCFHEATEVTFAPLSEEVVDSYVRSGEPLDKAGAYGIQGLGGTLVKGISGDYFNVVGLPLHRLCIELLSVLQK